MPTGAEGRTGPKRDETKGPEGLSGDITNMNPDSTANQGQRHNTVEARPINGERDQQPRGEFEYRIEGSDGSYIHGNSSATDGFRDLQYGGRFFGPHGPILGISGEGLLKFLSEPSTRVRNDYMIFDLRNADEDFKDSISPQQIKDVVHFPLYMDSPTGIKDGRQIYNYNDLVRPDDQHVALWDQLLNDNTLNVRDWANMRYIFFHCVAGKNRTPATAAGYFKAIAQHSPNPPQIVVIEMGFDGFAATEGSGQFLEAWRL